MIKSVRSYHFIHQTATTPRSTKFFLSMLSVQFLTKHHQMPPFCTKLPLLLSPVCRENNRISNSKDAYLLNSSNSHLLGFSLHKSPSNHSTPHFIFFQYTCAKNLAFKQQTKEQELPNIFFVLIFLFIFLQRMLERISLLSSSFTNSNNTKNQSTTIFFMHVFWSCFSPKIVKFHHPEPNCLSFILLRMQRI